MNEFKILKECINRISKYFEENVQNDLLFGHLKSWESYQYKIGMRDGFRQAIYLIEELEKDIFSFKEERVHD